MPGKALSFSINEYFYFITLFWSKKPVRFGLAPYLMPITSSVFVCNPGSAADIMALHGFFNVPLYANCMVPKIAVSIEFIGTGKQKEQSRRQGKEL